MGWQPGADGGTGTDPTHGRSLPGASPVRDPRLSVFAGPGREDAPLPSGALALLADELSGPERRCPGATDNERTGLLQVFDAIESWAAAGKLGVIRAMMRADGLPSPGAGHGDLPETWSPSLRHELAAVLACPVQSADTTAWLAWELEARLPGLGALLDQGVVTEAKARAVAEVFRYLDDTDAARAEALILGQLAGKTYPQVMRLAEQAALTVDPGLAERRREQAQKKDARVSLFRENAGTAGLSGRDLPPDAALAAMASVNARAVQYLESDQFGDARMDLLRAYAYLDLLNGVSAETRIAAAELHDEAVDLADDLAWAQARAARSARATGQADGAAPGGGGPADGGSGPDDGGPHDGGPHDGGPGNGDPGGGGPGDAPGGGHDDGVQGGHDGGGHGGHDGGGHSGHDDGGHSGGRGPEPARPASGGFPRPPRPADLIVPLATLVGRAARPGEVQGFGPVDPALARAMAEAAAASPDTSICVTVTSPEGYAIGHGCARPARRSRLIQRPGGPDGLQAQPSPAKLPARLNLTIPASGLSGLHRESSRLARESSRLPRDCGPWSFASSGGTDPPGARGSPVTATSTDDFGTWTLTVPGGRQFTVRLEPVPVFDCDHRQETGAYQPGARLRHLVQVRDGTCTFPSCNRHARESDFEHAQPYDQGGRTCACNAGARSRACHRIKQSKGWEVTQPRPGWHQWTTPSGRTYTQEPWRYPA